MKIKLENKYGSFLLGKGNGGFRLITAEGFTAGEYEPQVRAHGMLDGGTIDGVHLPPRTLKMRFAVFGEGSELERQGLIGFFDPKQELALTAERAGLSRMISGHISSFAIRQERENGLMKAELAIICPDPYFKSTSPREMDLSRISPQISFPSRILSTGTIAGYKLGPGEVTLENSGHDETGFYLSALVKGASAKNITVTNLATGEYILFQGTLEQGAVLEISTVRGDKFVRVSGSNAVHKIDRKSKFFALATGENRVACTAESGTEGLDLKFWFTPRYLGV